MIRKLKSLLSGDGRPADAKDETCVRHCVAVLLVEIARADHSHCDHEDEEIRRQLVDAFGVSDKEASDLLSEARHEVEQSVSLQQFTRRLHDEMTYDEKRRVIEMMWRIALADRQLDKYEDYMIGKIAELLYISRGDVLRERNRVREATDPDR